MTSLVYASYRAGVLGAWLMDKEGDVFVRALLSLALHALCESLDSFYFFFQVFTVIETWLKLAL